LADEFRILESTNLDRIFQPFESDGFCAALGTLGKGAGAGDREQRQTNGH
jgi:hypothetical protein